MKEKLTNNLVLKLVSIVVAFIVWLVVIDISNPEVSGLKTVPLQIEGESIISGAGKTYTVNGGTTVAISYVVRSKDQNKISADDFRAYIDLANLYDVTGAVPVYVEIVNNASLFIGTPVARPGVMTVSTEDIQRKEFKLSTSTKGEPASGYSVGSISLDPESVYVNGPVSVIGRISSVGVEVDVTGAGEDLSGVTKPVFYDANGNKISIDDSSVYFDNGDIQYTVSMLKGKALLLKFDVGGEVANGYRFMGAESSTKSISVIGLPQDLNNLSTVEIPASVLNLNNATADKTISLDVAEFLPDNVEVSGNSQITVTLKVEALHKKSFTLTLDDIEQVGHTYGYSYRISPERVTVLISGVEEELAQISARTLGAKIDYTHLSKGTHTGSLSFSLAEGLALDSYTPFELIVYDENEAETETQENEESEESDTQAGSESQTSTQSTAASSSASDTARAPEESAPAQTQ